MSHDNDRVPVTYSYAYDPQTNTLEIEFRDLNTDNIIERKIVSGEQAKLAMELIRQDEDQHTDEFEH
jgi:hypothetical protein